MSFFILPYVVAGVLWLRNRDEWKPSSRLFVGLSFAALVIYALRARRAAVGGRPLHRRPTSPAVRPVRAACSSRPAGCPTAACSARMQTSQDGANAWVERIVGRGWGKLNLHTASALIDQGQASVNLVAAIPSLHAGMTLAIAAFLWNRVNRGWRPLLVAYVLVMAFTLVYTAEHYVVDILLGWALAALVMGAMHWISCAGRGRQWTSPRFD